MFCPGCGKEIPDVAVATCPTCGATLRHAPAADPSPAPGAPGIPWEDRTGLGFFPALFATLRTCLLDPDQFYRKMAKRQHMGSALGYLVLLGWIGSLGGIFWNLLLQGSQESLFRALGMTPPNESMAAGIRTIVYCAIAILAPVLILIVTFIWAGILHLMLWVLGAAKEGFEATLRVYAYAAGSTALFQWVPICGGLVGVVWSLVLQIYGLSRIHGISGGRAALAVLLPLAFCCVLFAVLAALFAGALLAALHG